VNADLGTRSEKWPVKPLGEVARIVGGATPKTGNSEFWDGSILWATPKDLSDLGEKHLISTPRKITELGLKSCSAEILPVNSVLFSSRAPIGLVAINRVPVSTNQGFKSFIPESTVLDSDYLYHWLLANRPYIQGLGNGATFKEVSKSVVSRIKIPIPSLTEQKRIAAILDKADAIRRKRQQALHLADEFLRSVFLDMFGDPVRNPMGWEVLPIETGIDAFVGGKNVAPIDTARSDGIRVLKVSAVTSGDFLEKESKSFSQDFDIPPDYIVKQGDLLISRANTKELIGAVAYVWNTSGKSMLPDKLWRFVWSDPMRIHPLFMLHMARSAHFRNQLILRATGTSGSMKNIGKAKMLEIPIPLPPIDLQERFAKIASQARKMTKTSMMIASEANALFASIQQLAFLDEI